MRLDPRERRLADFFLPDLEGVVPSMRDTAVAAPSPDAAVDTRHRNAAQRALQSRAEMSVPGRICRPPRDAAPFAQIRHLIAMLPAARFAGGDAGGL